MTNNKTKLGLASVLFAVTLMTTTLMMEETHAETDITYTDNNAIAFIEKVMERQSGWESNKAMSQDNTLKSTFDVKSNDNGLVEVWENFDLTNAEGDILENRKAYFTIEDLSTTDDPKYRVEVPEYNMQMIFTNEDQVKPAVITETIATVTATHLVFGATPDSGDNDLDVDCDNFAVEGEINTTSNRRVTDWTGPFVHFDFCFIPWSFEDAKVTVSDTGSFSETSTFTDSSDYSEDWTAFDYSDDDRTVAHVVVWRYTLI